MQKEAVVYTYNGILFSLKQEGNPIICDNMDEHEGQYAERNKAVTEGQICHDSTYMSYLK